MELIVEVNTRSSTPVSILLSLLSKRFWKGEWLSVVPQGLSPLSEALRDPIESKRPRKRKGTLKRFVMLLPKKISTTQDATH